MGREKVDAIVLAGGSLDKFDLVAAPSAKGLLKVAGKTMVEYVLEALSSADRVGRIVVLLPSSAAPGPWSRLAEKVIYNNGIITENISKAITYLGTEGKMLLVSSDIPLISGKIIDGLMQACDRVSADVYYPIIKRETAEIAFPNTNRTYMKLRDGTFTGGNIFLVDKKTFLNNRAQGEEIFSYRKSPIKLMKILGPTFILKFIFHRLSITGLENKGSQLLNSRVRAVITEDAEVGVDVDKQEDLELFNRILGG